METNSVTKITWGVKECSVENSLYKATRSIWRVILSTDTNPNYLAFLPSVVDHFLQHLQTNTSAAGLRVQFAGGRNGSNHDRVYKQQ